MADHVFHKVDKEAIFKNTKQNIQDVGEGDIATTVLIMLYHIKEADAVFMNKVNTFR